MRIKLNENNYSVSERQYRLYRFLSENANKDYVLSSKRIYDYLDDLGIQITPATLYNDLRAIESMAKIKIEYDQSKKGYYIKNPKFQPHELRMIVDSVQASQFITQKEAEKITAKVVSLTDIHTASKLKRQAYVANRIRSMNESVVKDTDRIFEAISTDRKIAFKFFHYTRNKKKEYSKSGKLYIVSPYAMVWRDGFYYLYAFVDGENRFRHFRVDRMDNISKPLLDLRAGKDKYSEKALTQRTVKEFGINEGKEAIVSLRFTNGLVDAVMDAFGQDVIMTPTDETHFTISANVRLNMAFYAWLFSFGRGVKIISPPAVKEKMREYAKNIADMYKDEAEK